MKFNLSKILYDNFSCVLENIRNCVVKSKRIFVMVEKYIITILLKIKDLYVCQSNKILISIRNKKNLLKHK